MTPGLHAANDAANDGAELMDTHFNPLGDFLSRAWWLLLLRGLAAIAFGVLTFVWPQVTLLTLVILYGVYAILDGAFALLGAIRGGGLAPRWWLAVVGLVGLAAGAVALALPDLTAVALVVIIGAAAIARGIFEIVGAIQLRKTIRNEWLLILSGAISVLFGLAVIVVPGAGALALVWLIGAWAIVAGVLTVALALKLRKITS